MIISPCISICKSDPQTGYCYGCGRTENEKKKWKDKSTSEEWKNENLIDCHQLCDKKYLTVHLCLNFYKK